MPAYIDTVLLAAAVFLLPILFAAAYVSNGGFAS